jgi:hypothetical protein
MEYREGMGFLDDETMLDAALLGIGTAPVKPVMIERQVPVEYQQPRDEYVTPRVEQLPNEVEMDQDVVEYKTSKYLNSFSTNKTPVVQEEQKNDNGYDFMNDVLGMERKPEQQQVQSESNDVVLDYRKSIVSAAIKLGQDPAEIEEYIISLTPEEQVMIAATKRDYMKRQAQASQQQSQPQRLEFQSLKARPATSIATTQAAPQYSNSQPITRSNVIENKIRNQFY